MMPIGALSKRTGVHIETIRYYERVRILPKALRSANGRRVYGEEDARRLTVIRHARELGFDLNSVRALLDLQDHPERSCEAASHLALVQLKTVEKHLRRLVFLRDELTRIANSCCNGRAADCRVIDGLANSD